MTRYQSILPLENEEHVSLTGHNVTNIIPRNNCSSEERRWYRLWMSIPAFCVGVLGVAVLFVQTSSLRRTVLIQEAPFQQESFQQWEDWKEEMVQAALHFASDVSAAWSPSSLSTDTNDEAMLLQQVWMSPQVAQTWWNDISETIKEQMSKLNQQTQETAVKAGQWADQAASNTQKWAQEESQHAGQWLESAANQTENVVGEAASETEKFAQEAGEETGKLVNNAAKATKHFASDKGKQAKQWADGAAENTKEWTKDAENTTGHWIGEESKEAGEWIQTEAGRAEHAAGNAAHWAGDEAKDAGQWIKKEGNATGHFIGKEAEEAGHFIGEESKAGERWIGNETERTGEWIGDETKRGAAGTKQWFEKESNVTEHWISQEARKSSRWFGKEAQETEHWFQKEGNATGQWFKKQSNRTVHWFEADAVAVRLWWSNITHRDRVQDESLAYFNTTAAFALLVSGYGWYDSSRDFFAYQQGLDVQENEAYCAVATAAAVINSFRGRLDLPIDSHYNPYQYATEDSLFNECTDENVTVHNETFDGLMEAPGGLNLDQTKALLECNLPSSGWSVTARHVDPNDVSLDDMRKDLVLALMSPASRVIVNFNRAAATQSGGGHFSPLGGYSHERDAFLVMDVAKYKYPYVWMPAPVLYRSLMTVDACGSFKSPDAQVKLKSSHPDLSQPTSARDLAKSMSKLGCKAAFRGYIIVQQL